MALLAAVAALAGCGADDGEQIVSGPGFTFSAPAGWEVEAGGRTASASPGAGATELVSVRVFRLARPYRPQLWDTVVPELDRVARDLAEQLGGRIVSSAVVVVDGRRAKRYEIRYERDDAEIVERTAFVLEGRRELQLICRYGADDADAAEACDLLFSTLTLA